MSLVDILGGVNCGLVFFFGAALSVSIAGGCSSRREWALLFALCPVFFALQTVSWLVWGLDATKFIYPLLIHLPLLLILILGLKKPAGISLVSVCTAYLCCQLPRCAGVMTAAATGSALVGQLVYSAAIAPIFFFLLRYFVPSAQDTMTESRKALLLFGSLPVIYYLYDYTVAARISLLYAEILSPGATYSTGEVVAETLPMVVGLLYMAYTTAYRQQLQRQTQTELLNSMMAVQLKQAEAEMASLRQADAQSAIHRHDMRHHLSAIDGFLSAGRPEQAREYIKGVQSNIESVTPRRFCQNELVNLICSSFADRGEQAGVSLNVNADLPDSPAIPDVELCALFSNALENAIAAAGAMEEAQRWVSCVCTVRAGKLLIEVKNPYKGAVVMRDGLPASNRKGHGYGCSSIRTIAERNHGLCEFKAERGVFTLRMVLPVRSG